MATVSEIIDMMMKDNGDDNGDSLSVNVKVLADSIVQNTLTSDQLGAKLVLIKSSIDSLTTTVSSLSDTLLSRINNESIVKTTQATESDRIESSAPSARNGANDTLLNAPLSRVLDQLIDAVYKVSHSDEYVPGATNVVEDPKNKSIVDDLVKLNREASSLAQQAAELDLYLADENYKNEKNRVAVEKELNKLKLDEYSKLLASAVETSDDPELRKFKSLQESRKAQELFESSHDKSKTAEERAKATEEYNVLRPMNVQKYDTSVGASLLTSGEAKSGIGQGFKMMEGFAPAIKELSTVVKTTGGPILIVADAAAKMLNSVVRIENLIGAIPEGLQLLSTTITTGGLLLVSKLVSLGADLINALHWGETALDTARKEYGKSANESEDSIIKKLDVDTSKDKVLVGKTRGSLIHSGVLDMLSDELYNSNNNNNILPSSKLGNVDESYTITDNLIERLTDAIIAREKSTNDSSVTTINNIQSLNGWVPAN